jgi:hypothetical protein
MATGAGAAAVDAQQRRAWNLGNGHRGLVIGISHASR